MHERRWTRLLAVALCACLALTGCAKIVDGSPSVVGAADAHLDVKGANGGTFDQVVENALSDIMAFWKTEYPKISGGKPLTALAGGLYSVDGEAVARTKQLTGPARDNACAKQDIGFVVDNGAFCPADDSISWDRSPNHLFAQLGKKYGDLTVALIFAHEFGHAISYRQGAFRQDLPTYDTESQADCAAGAWAASALKGQDPHFRGVTDASLDQALEGFLDGRDQTPDSSAPDAVSHGNGFDRLSALANGIEKGAAYCYSPSYFSSLQPTERAFSDKTDYEAGGNEPLEPPASNPGGGVLSASNDNFFVKDLNRFWTSAAKSINKSFQPVKIAEADHPPCDSSAQFGYCADTNTVYYSTAFAREAYYSLPAATGAPSGNANVQLLNNQPADFALGVLFAMGWGLAVRHQLFNRSVDDGSALRASICYTGAYAKDINIPSTDPEAKAKFITLSPADLDEATSAMLNNVDRSGSFGARGTTGLDRIQAFVKGYHGGLSVC